MWPASSAPPSPQASCLPCLAKTKQQKRTPQPRRAFCVSKAEHAHRKGRRSRPLPHFVFLRGTLSSALLRTFLPVGGGQPYTDAAGSGRPLPVSGAVPDFTSVEADDSVCPFAGNVFCIRDAGCLRWHTFFWLVRKKYAKKRRWNGFYRADAPEKSCRSVFRFVFTQAVVKTPFGRARQFLLL